MRQKNKIKSVFRLPFRIWFWILFIIIMSILFFCNRQSIAKTVAKIKESAKLESPKIINSDIKKIVEGNREKNESIKNKGANEDAIEESIPKSIPSIEDDNEKSAKDEPKELKEDIKENIDEPREKDIREEKVEDNEKELLKRDICVYFATVNTDGMVSLEKCERLITRTPSPMIDSIKTLLEGPTIDEAKKGFRSFIPPDTKLLSASIKNGLAIIDFSEDFQFNRYGVEGYNIQLQQIVFTVCSFPSVSSVQFLIEGQKKDFLSSDGVWIGSPFTIESF